MTEVAGAVRRAGVVGAGGAGFPTHVKLSSRAEWFLANGAECEPLLHKDCELMIHHAAEILAGLQIAAEAVEASRVYVGVKSKNREALEALRGNVRGRAIQISEFGDFYPSGDEYEVVYKIMGRLIPSGGIPLDVGAVVNNVETLYQVHAAVQGAPVTETFLTVAGAVRDPVTCWAPLGTSVKDLLEFAGGTTVDEFIVMSGGLMMGRLIEDLEKPVTKQTAGLIVLPLDHPLTRRYKTPPRAQARIGKSACDQCTYCTELCPRYLLGYDIQPHAVMRSLEFTSTGSELWNEYALLCCACGICTLYACPEALYPREACLDSIRDLAAKGIVKKRDDDREVKVHPMKEYRRVPMTMLMKRLGVEAFDVPAPYSDRTLEPERVRIPMSQHAGAAAKPCVREGASISKGEPIGRIPEGALGAPVHASISGRVHSVSSHEVELRR